MTIREIRMKLGDTQREFADRYHIPFRTVQNWETGQRKPPAYVMRLLEERFQIDFIHRRTAKLPQYSQKKENLPKRSDYVGALHWLKAVCKCIGDPVVFALDEALMCQGLFGGRSDEYIVWVYGKDSVTHFNGVALLGNQVSPYCVKEKNGIFYTDFNRTLSDSFANESILDMQGITEAISKFYYQNGENFDGISIAPEYQTRFDNLAIEAISYYNN